MTRRIVLWLAVALLMGACTRPQEPLRIGTLLWPPYDLAYLAQAKGHFDRERIELVDYQTPAEVVRASRNGLIDGYFLTTQFALGGHAGENDARIVYVIDRSSGGDSLLVRPGIDTLDQLEGGTIALEASPLSVYMLQRMLDRSGMSRGEIELEFVDTPDQVSAYTSGRVDAVITYEPFRSRVLEAGAVEQFSSADIPGEIVDVLFVSDELIENRIDDLVALVRGLEGARQFLASHPEQALPIMAERHVMDPEAFARMLNGMELVDLEENLRLLGGAQPALSDSIETQVKVFERAELRHPGMSPAEPDARIVEQALQ